MGLATVPVSAQAAITYNLFVECTGEYGGSILVPEGDSVEVTQTGCFIIEVDAGSVSPEPVGDTPAETFTVTPDPTDGYAEVYLSDGDGSGFWLEVNSAPLLDPLAGELLATTNLTIPETPSEFFVEETEDGEHYLGGRPECAVEAGAHVFQTLGVVISESGAFTFRAIGTDPASAYLNDFEYPYYPIEDPALAVYTEFDPADPDANVVGCNDDRDDDDEVVGDGSLADGTLIDDHYPQFGADLEPGVYTLVLTTYDTIGADDWATGDDGSFTPRAQSTEFELWGPAGALQLLAPPVFGDILPAASVPVGSPYSVTLETTGTTPIVYAVTAGALPTGLSLDPATGVISGTPSVVGSYAYTITATNAAGFATHDYAQVVTAAVVEPPPGPPPGVVLPIVSG